MRRSHTISAIAIRGEHREAGMPQFRAIAGQQQSVGRTMGEALDALTAGWGDDVQETAIVIQRLQSDAYFTAAPRP